MCQLLAVIYTYSILKRSRIEFANSKTTATSVISHSVSMCNSPRLKLFLSIRYRSLHNKVTTKEIQIPVQFGHVAGKLWGSSDGRPILALHGWQDNAGTWDSLAPMLINKDRSILAIDLPGHGLSSWIPPGMHYHSWEIPRLILYLKKYFKWDKVSLLCHSLSAIAGTRYASLYPDDVDSYVALDKFIYDEYDGKDVVDKYPNLLIKGLIAQDRLEKEPPIHTMDEIKRMWHLGSNKSVAIESVHYLAKRGVKQSKKDPTKYYVSRDFRLKYGLLVPESKEFVAGIVSRLKSPMLYVKALDSIYETNDYAVGMRNIIVKNNKKFEMHFVPGTHHVHLNNPERVAPLILNFLTKYA